MDRFEEMHSVHLFKSVHQCIALSHRQLFDMAQLCLKQNAYFTKILMSQKAVGSRSSGQEAGFSSAGRSLRQCHCVTFRYGYPLIAVSSLKIFIVDR
jgi:hypothetical protein